MKKIRRAINKKVGKPPGEAVYTGNYSEEQTKLIYRFYNPDTFDEVKPIELSEIKPKFNSDVNWIELSGFNDIEFIKKFGEQFAIHQMLIEDIVNTHHLPKFEENDEYIAVVLKAFSLKENGESYNRNNICIILKDQFVLDIHEFSNNINDSKIERIKLGKGKARKKGADYLFYVLLDSYIDTYYLVFDDLSDRLYDLEDLLLGKSKENLIEQIHKIKKEITELRKFLFPLREAIAQIIKDEPELIEEDNLIYFRDLLDHLNQLTEYFQMYNDMVKSLVDLNTSNINNNINQVMKFLTIIATIFIPLTFIAGIYGMNFEYMPELQFKYGYYVVVISMVLLGISMFLYMKMKRWF